MHKRMMVTGIAAVIAAMAAYSGAQEAKPPSIRPPPSELPTPDPSLGKDKVIGLDHFFNHQVKNGQQFHYVWADPANSGFSLFGEVWTQYGATITKVDKAPTRADLDKLSVYIIVNPSTEKTAADGKPNYITAADADVIEQWVKDGGVLLMFANDKNNSEFDHYNILAQRFGIKFNGDLRNQVPVAMQREPGAFHVSKIAPDVPLFKGIKDIYMKEISTLTVNPPAQAILVADKEDHSGKDNIMATANVGKGFVFAVGDPWIYNEYIDVTAPGENFQNRKAAMNLVSWTLPMSKVVK